MMRVRTKRCTNAGPTFFPEGSKAKIKKNISIKTSNTILNKNITAEDIHGITKESWKS
ncbi:MAG: hypothetical protein GY774_32270 [Planctomycetes bacterium]|nr:hypothetical protein [Planctomycetota bacterium]